MKYRGMTAMALLLWVGSAQAATLCDIGPVGASACNPGVGAIYQNPPNDFPGETEIPLFIDDGFGTVNTGHAGAQTGDPTFYFTTDVPVGAASGSAQIGQGNDTFHTLDITLDDGWTFGDFGFDTQSVNSRTGGHDISISAFLGNVLKVTYAATGLGNGEVSWMVLALADTLFDKISITSSGADVSIGGFKKSDHFEVSRLSETPAVPIPAALPLFGTALAGLVLLRQRQRRRGTSQPA